MEEKAKTMKTYTERLRNSVFEMSAILECEESGNGVVICAIERAKALLAEKVPEGKDETIPPDTYSREEAIFFAIEYHLYKIGDFGDINEHDINDAEDFISSYKPLSDKGNKNEQK